MEGKKKENIFKKSKLGRVNLTIGWKMYNLLNTFQPMNAPSKSCSTQVNIANNYALPENTLTTHDSCYPLTVPL